MRFITYSLFFIFSVVGLVSASENSDNPITTPIRYDGHIFVPPTPPPNDDHSNIGFSIGIGFGFRNADRSANNYVYAMQLILNDTNLKSFAYNNVEQQLTTWAKPKGILIDYTTRLTGAILSGDFYTALNMMHNFKMPKNLPMYALITTNKFMSRLTHQLYYNSGENMGAPKNINDIDRYWVKTIYQEYIDELSKSFIVYVGVDDLITSCNERVVDSQERTILIHLLKCLKVSFVPIDSTQVIDQQLKTALLSNINEKYSFINSTYTNMGWWTWIKLKYNRFQHDSSMISASFDEAIRNNTYANELHSLSSYYADNDYQGILNRLNKCRWLDREYPYLRPHAQASLDQQLLSKIAKNPDLMYQQTTPPCLTGTYADTEQATSSNSVHQEVFAQNVDILSPAAQELLNACELTSPPLHTVAPEHQLFIQRSEVILNSAAQAHQDGTVDNAAIAETIVLTSAAQELELAGQSNKAKALLVATEKKWDSLAAPTAQKNDQDYMPDICDEHDAEAAALQFYGRIFGHAGRRMWHNVKHPTEFVHRQVDGLKNLTLLAAKSLNTTAKFLSEDPELIQEACSEIKSAAHVIGEAVKSICAMSQPEFEEFFGNFLGDCAIDAIGLKGLGKAASSAKQAIKSKSITLIESTAQAFKGNESRIPLYEKAAAKLKALRNKKSLISTKTTATEASSSANKVSATSKASAAASSSEIEQAVGNAKLPISHAEELAEMNQAASTIKHPVVNSRRVGSALKTDFYHNFDKIIDNFARYAEKFELIGGDKIKRVLYQIEGSLNGEVGLFEWILDSGKVTHRCFIKGGKITGKPNMFQRK